MTINKCTGHLSGKHCGCSNIRCGKCGSASCCWCGDAQPNTADDKPCEDCQTEIDMNTIAVVLQ